MGHLGAFWRVEFAQMVRVPHGAIVPDLKTIGKIAQQNPGSLWLVGNEMDVIWQDNATPEQYAAAYHDVYATLKQADPNSRVAIGGISEPSPLRLQISGSRAASVSRSIWAGHAHRCVERAQLHLAGTARLVGRRHSAGD